jgi:hypothetical protein
MLSNLSALEHAKTYYLRKMEEISKEDAPYMNSEQLEEKHQKYRERAMDIFKSLPKIGGKELPAQFLEQLEAFINVKF